MGVDTNKMTLKDDLVVSAYLTCFNCDVQTSKNFEPSMRLEDFEKYKVQLLCQKCSNPYSSITPVFDFETRYRKSKHEAPVNKQPVSVLEAKRKHEGTWTILGKIVTVSEMCVIEMETETGVVYKDAKSIQLEDIEKLDENERLDVMLYNDDITNVIPGEVVEIVGNIELVSKNAKKSKVKTVVVNATSIKYVNRKELIISNKDIEAIEKFAHSNYELNLTERLGVLFAPNVVGHKDAKLGLLRSIVGGDNHGQRGGGRINTFMVGDPGTAKSTLAQEAAMIKPNSRHVSAPHASSKTITGIADKENESVTLRLGAIPLSRNAICAIDELTAFAPEEQSRLLDVLEEGILDIDKHGRHWTIQSPTTIIATANPIQSKWSNSEVVSNDEINMLKTLLDRFQQVYIFRDNMNEKEIDSFVAQMSTIKNRRRHNYNFLRKYLIYVSGINVRSIIPEAEYMLNEFWKTAKLKKLMGIRGLLAIFSVAEAQAKLHLKDTINEEIANQTMEVFKLMLVQYGEMITTATSPKTMTYNKFLEILQNNKVGVSTKLLCQIACHEDKQIAAYIGENWSIEHNIKVRVIIDMLRNHSQVKEISRKPVVLQWDGILSDNNDNNDTDKESEEKLLDVDNRNKTISELSELSDRSVEGSIVRNGVSYNLVLIYKGSEFLNRLQYRLRSCPSCNEELDSDPYYRKFHQCKSKSTPGEGEE
jgi:MoxR-like ATPase